PNLFGAPKPAQDAPAAQSNPFAALSKLPEPQDKAEPKSLFGGIASLPNKSEPAQAAANFAGQAPAPAEKEQDKATKEAKNPFGSLFGNKPAASATESDKPLTSPFKFAPAPAASATEPDKPATSPFKFTPAPAPAAPSQPVQSAPSPAFSLFSTAPKPAASAPSLFNTLNTPTQGANEAPAFGSKAATPAATAQDKVSSAIPNFSESVLEQLDTPCPLARPAKRVQASVSEERPLMFNSQNQVPTPIKQGHSLFTPTDSSAASSSQPMSAPASSTAPSTVPPTTGAKKRLFQPFNSDAPPSAQPAAPASPAPRQSPLPAFGSTTASATDTSAAATTTPKPSPAGHVVTKPVFAQPAASSIPGHLNAEGYKEFDSQDKLRALNRAFRNRIIAVDVATHDIDTLLRAYVAARSSIGADIGLYQRTIAGTKRKTDEPAEPAVPSAYKKARSEPRATLLDGMIPKSPTKPSDRPCQTPSDQAQGGSGKPRNAFGSIQPLFGKSGATASAPPTFGQPSTSATPSKPAAAAAFQPSTTPAKSPPKPAGFPTFGHTAESSAKKRGAESAAKKRGAESTGKKRGAESLGDSKDSSADESQAGRRNKSEEQDRAKKAKYNDIPKTGFTPTFAAGAAPANANKGSPFEPDSDESEKATATDLSRDPTPEQIDREIAANPNKGMSLFDRISAPSGKDTIPPGTNGNPTTPHVFESTTKPGWKPSLKFAGLGKSTPEQPAFSPFTPDPSFKPATTFNFTPSSTPTTNGADSTSVLGGAAAKVDSKFEGMFGSRPSTPSQIDRPADAPTSASATPLDNTWKQGSPIKFGSSTPDGTAEPPKFSFTAPSPWNKNDGDATTPKPFGGLAAPHLGLGGSATSSGLSSRQSSPGLTDNDSAATDVTDTEGPAPDEQAKINESRAGEEDEECVYEVATVKALRLVNKKTANEKEAEGTWITVGQGPLRLLKNKDGKTRLLVRNSTNGNPILNEYLIPKLEWKVQQQNGKTGAIKGALVQGGNLSQWVIKIKLGKEHGLCEALEEQRKAQ
ncbi:hypothetical protein DV737_g5808, partial [Chaetothyriales sp. CBS 132003]